MFRTATLTPGDVIDDKDISCLGDTYLSSFPSSASIGSPLKSSNFAPLAIARNTKTIIPSSANEPNADLAPPVQCPGAENCTIG